MQQSGYINTIIDPRPTDVDNTVEYEECGENVDKSIYEQLSTERNSSNHDYIVLTSNSEAGSKQLDNQVHQKKQAQLRQLFLILFCITITASVTAVATFFPTKQLMERNNKYKRRTKYTRGTVNYKNTALCITTCDNDTEVGQQKNKTVICRHNETIDNQPCSKEAGSCKVPCSTEPCENDGACMNDTCFCNDGFAGSKCEIDVNQTCKSNANTLIQHPNTCQLYYNCSQSVSPLSKENRRGRATLRPAYLHECHYPELFSTTTLSCQNYSDVTCGSRYETKNKCDYLADGYVCYVSCRACIEVTPNCVGFSDGIYRNIHIPDQYEVYFECLDERNIYIGENPCQSNKAPYNGKCQDLFEIPPSNYQVGYGIDCSGRPNGNYKNDQGRCDIYYTCVNGNSALTHCSSGKNFDTKTSFCQNPENACAPCSSVSNGC